MLGQFWSADEVRLSKVPNPVKVSSVSPGQLQHLSLNDCMYIH